MPIEIVILILVAGLFLLLATGLEIGISVMILALIGFALVIHQPLFQIPLCAFCWWNSFVMTAVPLFIFMGAVFVKSGITRYLFDGVNAWVGRIPGGLGISVIGACALFAAMSGSSLASAAAMGTVSIPEMERYKYSSQITLGVVAAGGTLGILIPPSINMIVYGAWTGTSVVRLFAAGIIPGLILAALFAALVIIRVLINPSLAPRMPSPTWKERFKSSIGILPWLATIAAVLGVIFAGIMTPTEAAALGSAISLILAFLYRRLSFQVVKEAGLMAVRITAMIGLVASAAIALVYVVTYLEIPELVVAGFTGLPIGKYGIIACICIMYIILGMFLDPISMMLLTLPFITPVILAIGYNMVWFGILLIVLSEMAFLTPPVGMNLYIIHSIAPQYSIMTIARACLPFLIPMMAVVVLLIALPQIPMWLPGIFFG